MSTEGKRGGAKKSDVRLEVERITATGAYVDLDELVSAELEKLDRPALLKYARRGMARSCSNMLHRSPRVALDGMDGIDFPMYIAIPLGSSGRDFLYRLTTAASVKDIRAWFKARDGRVNSVVREHAKNTAFFKCVIKAVPKDADESATWTSFIETPPV